MGKQKLGASLSSDAMVVLGAQINIRKIGRGWPVGWGIGCRMDKCFLSMLKSFKKVFMRINMLHRRGI
jgi:hypothetical protein